jgi:hypothetical protein
MSLLSRPSWSPNKDEDYVQTSLLPAASINIYSMNLESESEYRCLVLPG